MRCQNSRSARLSSSKDENFLSQILLLRVRSRSVAARSTAISLPVGLSSRVPLLQFAEVETCCLPGFPCYRTCLLEAATELDLSAASFEDLDAYLGRLWARGQAPSTIAGKASVLRSFFEWGVLTQRFDSSPARHLRGPRVYQPEASFLTPGEIDKLIFRGQRGRMPTNPFAARDRALLAVSYVCGLRVSEPGQLRAEHLQYDSGTWSILIQRAKAADRDRRLPIGDPVVSRMLGHYLELRSKIASCPWLFPSRPRRGQARISDRHIHRIFDRAVKSAGIRKKGRRITFHILRHSIATHLHAEGWPPKAIQRWMRHRRFSTTERYVHVGDDQCVSCGVGRIR